MWGTPLPAYAESGPNEDGGIGEQEGDNHQFDVGHAIPAGGTAEGGGAMRREEVPTAAGPEEQVVEHTKEIHSEDLISETYLKIYSVVDLVDLEDHMVLQEIKQELEKVQIVFTE